MSGNIRGAGATVAYRGTDAAAWLAAALAMLCGCMMPPAVAPADCGDGVVDGTAGEECDESGESTSSCNRDCTRPVCGDGYTNPAAGEECDDGGQVSGDGCSATCLREGCGGGILASCVPDECGDGAVGFGESCDDGNQVSGDGCSATCRLEYCGDGVVDPGESCDERGVDTATCDRDCTRPSCGDGQANAEAGEECETEVESRFCDSDCTFAWCGDGMVNPAAGEGCDDGGPSASCNVDCTPSVCGDGMINPIAGETCDDGALEPGDGCSALCRLESCGNGVVDPGEACDTAGVDTESCDGDCTTPLCGDLRVNAAAGEQCDDGNADDSDWCLPSCMSASCDDGIRNGDERDVDCGGQCESCGGMVVAGGVHTCALLETGAVRCWGDGYHGQLGYGATDDIGDTETPATAGDVDVGGVVVQLAAGEYHTCALLETGAVRCWGFGMYGRLGYSNTSSVGDNETPATAGDVDVDGVVVQLAAGQEHTCALLATGAVRCWGVGSTGALGYGNTNSVGGHPDHTPVTAGDVDVGGVVVQLAAGWEHTCALLETGAVRCWGWGEDGRLGYGDTTTIGDTETPATVGDVDVGGVVLQLAAGGYHTCALMETGAVRCWGRGSHGQLGYGDTINIGDDPDETPATAGDVDVGGIVVQLAAGEYHTCALMETGAVRCWGSGLYGRLGYGNTFNIGDNETPASAGDVNVGGFVAQLAAGWVHTCALLEMGAVRCWGSGFAGRLGYGNTFNIGDNETPASAGDVPYR
jgi:cysteine-rich repeat protein